MRKKKKRHISNWVECNECTATCKIKIPEVPKLWPQYYASVVTKLKGHKNSMKWHSKDGEKKRHPSKWSEYTECAATSTIKTLEIVQSKPLLCVRCNKNKNECDEMMLDRWTKKENSPGKRNVKFATPHQESQSTHPRTYGNTQHTLAVDAENNIPLTITFTINWRLLTKKIKYIWSFALHV